MGEKRRRQAALRSLATMSLNEHVDDFRARVGSELRRRGAVRHRLEAVTEGGEVFEIDTSWRDDRERETVCRTLHGAIQRRGVTRYLMAAEARRTAKDNVRPSLDPDRTGVVQVIGVDRDGARRYFHAEIKRGGERPALGEWESDDESEGWIFELFDGADKDAPAAISDKHPLVTPIMDEDAVKTLDPVATRQFASSIEVAEEVVETIQRLHRPGEEWAAFGALMAIVAPFLSRGFRHGLRAHAQMVRDRPDVFPITPSVKPIGKAAITACMKKSWRRYHDPIAELLHGLDDEITFNVAMNLATQGGVSLMGGPGCADYLEQIAAETQNDETPG